jgi:hypothetical protein
MNDALLKNKEVVVVLFTGIERTLEDARTPRILKNTQIQKIRLK